MKIIKSREEIYLGSESENLHKFSVKVEEKSYDFKYAELELLREGDLSTATINALFSLNNISINSFKGYDSKEGLSLYYKTKGSFLFIFACGEKQEGLFVIFLEGVYDIGKEDPATENNSEIVKYSRFKLDSDPKFVGRTYPQMDKFSNRLKLTRDEIKKYTKYYIGEIPETLSLHDFEFNTKALKTDFVSSTFLALNGFFISEKAHSVLESMRIPNVIYYESTVVFRDKKYTLYFMNIKESDNINYEKSTFKLKDSPSSYPGETIQFKNSISHDNKIDELIDEGSDLDVFANQINLISKPPFFKLYTSNQYFISNELSEKLKSQNLTGYILEKSTLFSY